MTTYVALIRKGKRTSYGVEFPDFPGCITAGKTLDEALRLASEALALHIQGMIDDGDAIPPPTSPETVLTLPEAAGATLAAVSASTVRTRAVRINVTMDSRLLKEVDEAASGQGMTRSGWLAKAVRGALRSRRAA